MVRGALIVHKSCSEVFPLAVLWTGANWCSGGRKPEGGRKGRLRPVTHSCNHDNSNHARRVSKAAGKRSPEPAQNIAKTNTISRSARKIRGSPTSMEHVRVSQRPCVKWAREGESRVLSTSRNSKAMTSEVCGEKCATFLLYLNNCELELKA